MKSPIAIAAALGIDIAKLKFDVCLIKPNGKAKHKVFVNTRHGFEQLIRWLDSHQVTNLHACLEATGTYGEPLALFLFEAGCLVSLVNPAAVRAFANAGLSRTKTDKADAELIARFCLAQQPKAWQPPAPELRELQALVRRLESLALDARGGRKPFVVGCLGGGGQAKFGRTYCVSDRADQTDRSLNSPAY